VNIVILQGINEEGYPSFRIIADDIVITLIPNIKSDYRIP